MRAMTRWCAQALGGSDLAGAASSAAAGALELPGSPRTGRCSGSAGEQPRLSAHGQPGAVLHGCPRRRQPALLLSHQQGPASKQMLAWSVTKPAVDQCAPGPLQPRGARHSGWQPGSAAPGKLFARVCWGPLCQGATSLHCQPSRGAPHAPLVSALAANGRHDDSWVW